MMNLIRITDPGDSRLERLISLYEESFPVEERREIGQLKRMICEKEEMYFNTIECDGVLAGLFIYWDLKDFYYLEHLAVFAPMRNLKVGQQVLDYIGVYLPGLRIFEVEPAITEMTVRRVNYYLRNGYVILDTAYVQPSYQEDREESNLWIMGNMRSERLPEFIEVVKKVAYRDNR